MESCAPHQDGLSTTVCVCCPPCKIVEGWWQSLLHPHPPPRPDACPPHQLPNVLAQFYVDAAIVEAQLQQPVCAALVALVQHSSAFRAIIHRTQRHLVVWRVKG